MTWPALLTWRTTPDPLRPEALFAHNPYTPANYTTYVSRPLTPEALLPTEGFEYVYKVFVDKVSTPERRGGFLTV